MKMPKPYSDEWGWIEWLELTWAITVMLAVLLIFIEEMHTT